MKQKVRAFGLLLILLGSFFIFSPTVYGIGLGDDDEEEREPPPSDQPTPRQKAEKLWGTDGFHLVRMKLAECIDWALNFNPEITSADYSIRGAAEKKVQASRLGHPIIEYEYNVAPAPRDASDALGSFFSGDLTVFNKVRVVAAFPLYTFGKVKTGKQLAERGIEAEKEEREKKKAEIVFQVKQLYYGIQFAREVHRLLDSARDRVASEIRKREEKRGTDPSELLKLKLFLAELEKRIEEGEKREILALEALRVQMGLERHVRFDIASSRLNPLEQRIEPFEKYRQVALEKRSDLKLLAIGTQAKAKELKLEKRLMAPNLGVGTFFEFGRAPFIRNASVTDDFSNPFNFTRAGLGLQLKGQFDYHQSFSKIRALKSELYKVELMGEHARRGIDLELKESYLDLQNARQSLTREEEAGKLSRQLLFITQSNFDIGLAEPKDLIDAISSFLETRGHYFEAVFNYNRAWAKLEEKIGLLPAEKGEGS